MICCPWKVGKVTVCIQRSLAAMVPLCNPPCALPGAPPRGASAPHAAPIGPPRCPRLGCQNSARPGAAPGDAFAPASAKAPTMDGRRESRTAREKAHGRICAPLRCAGRALLACLLAGAIRGDAAPPRRTVSLAAACLSRPFSRNEPQAAASSLFHPATTSSASRGRRRPLRPAQSPDPCPLEPGDASDEEREPSLGTLRLDTPLHSRRNRIAATERAGTAKARVTAVPAGDIVKQLL